MTNFNKTLLLQFVNEPGTILDHISKIVNGERVVYYFVNENLKTEMGVTFITSFEYSCSDILMLLESGLVAIEKITTVSYRL